MPAGQDRSCHNISDVDDDCLPPRYINLSASPDMREGLNLTDKTISHLTSVGGLFGRPSDYAIQAMQIRSLSQIG